MNTIINKSALEEVDEIRKRIHYYKKIIISTSCPQKRLYFENVMLVEVDNLSGLIKKMCKEVKDDSEAYRQEKEFTLQELSSFDGAGGKPSYVAVNGVVYDVSNSLSWGGGSHFGLIAGKDLSAEFNKCHNIQAVLSKLPKVGVIKT